MTGEPTFEPIVFNPSRELTRDELLRLAKFAGNFGLDPAFQVEEQISQDDIDSLMKQHLGETFPKTKDDYLGKEHFWAIGEDLGIQRRGLSSLFMQLCYPARLGNSSARNVGDVVMPESLGLIVKRRREVGMPPSPVDVSGGDPPNRVRKHFTEWSAANGVIADSVIQVKGVVDLEHIRDQLGLYLNRVPLETYDAIQPKLKSIPDAQ